jgi:hypothetical protein
VKGEREGGKGVKEVLGVGEFGSLRSGAIGGLDLRRAGCVETVGKMPMHTPRS